MNTIAIKVENLKCSGCATTIIRGLKKLRTVEGVNVKVNESLVTIDYAEGANTDEFTHKLGEMGYPKEGTGNSLQKVKSYVSCAVGKVSA